MKGCHVVLKHEYGQTGEESTSAFHQPAGRYEQGRSTAGNSIHDAKCLGDREIVAAKDDPLAGLQLDSSLQVACCYLAYIDKVKHTRQASKKQPFLGKEDEATGERLDISRAKGHGWIADYCVRAIGCCPHHLGFHGCLALIVGAVWLAT